MAVLTHGTRLLLLSLGFVVSGVWSRPMLKSLAAVAALLPVIAFGQTMLITGTPIPVNTSPGVQTDPHVSGNYVTYTNEVGGNRINYFDLSSRTNGEVPNPNGDFDFLSDISGTNVVFTRVTSDRTAIFSFDLATGADPVEIAPQEASNRRAAAVGGSTVAWQDFGVADLGTSEIMVHDLFNGTIELLTSDGFLDKSTAVSPDGNMVAWVKCANTGRSCDVWRAVRSQDDGRWSSEAITGAEGEDAFPDTNGSFVTYDSTRTIGGISERDIYWQPGAAGVESRLDLAGAQLNPNVSSTVIAFEHFDSTAAIPNWDILLFDTATSTLYQLIRSDADETLNDIYVSGNIGQLVYTAADDVYAVSFELAAAPPPPPSPPPSPDEVVFPETAGTVQFFPEFAIGPQNAPVQKSVQSSYFRTTDQNREFRRGFAEFALPTVPDLFAANLRFNECRGISGFPLPPDSHELSYYAGADLVIDAADYGRATTPLTTFDTDVNLDPATFSYDVTDLFSQYQGTSLGLRFKLSADPTLPIMGFAGSEFCNIRIETVTLTEAPLRLGAEIEQLGLPNGLEPSLIAKLHAAYAALGSGNAAAACGSLGAFINQVNAQSGPSMSIPADTAAYIIGVATALREALNCP